jgi:hypothetical protein
VDYNEYELFKASLSQMTPEEYEKTIKEWVKENERRVVQNMAQDILQSIS